MQFTTVRCKEKVYDIYFGIHQKECNKRAAVALISAKVRKQQSDEQDEKNVSELF